MYRTNIKRNPIVSTETIDPLSIKSLNTNLAEPKQTSYYNSVDFIRRRRKSIPTNGVEADNVEADNNADLTNAGISMAGSIGSGIIDNFNKETSTDINGREYTKQNVGGAFASGAAKGLGMSAAVGFADFGLLSAGSGLLSAYEAYSGNSEVERQKEEVLKTKIKDSAMEAGNKYENDVAQGFKPKGQQYSTMYKHGGYLKKYPIGGELYNTKRAKELGYVPDETGHLPSVDNTNGMWLKSKEHPTAWMELLEYSLNPDLQKELKHPVINEEGYFGKNQLQYLPKKALALGGNIQPEYEVEGEEVVQGQDTNLENQEDLASDMTKAIGPSHEGGGVQGEGGERVFSDRLNASDSLIAALSALKMRVPKNATYATVAEKLGRYKSKFEDKLESHNSLQLRTGKVMVERIDSAIEATFQDQEMTKEMTSLNERVMKYGGTIPMFPTGGRIPIKVTDPNDPRLRAFNDSNTIRNAANKVYKDFYLLKYQLGKPNKNGDYGNPDRATDYILDTNKLTIEQAKADNAKESWKDTFDNKNIRGTNAMPFSHERHDPSKGGKGGNFFEKGWDAAVSKNPKLKDIQKRILPTNMSLEEEFQADLYKKPVQPYVYEKPIVKLKPIVKPNNNPLITYNSKQELDKLRADTKNYREVKTKDGYKTLGFEKIIKPVKTVKPTIKEQPVIKQEVKQPVVKEQTFQPDIVNTATPQAKTKFYQGYDFMQQTGLKNGDYTEQQIQEAMKNKGTKKLANTYKYGGKLPKYKKAGWLDELVTPEQGINTAVYLANLNNADKQKTSFIPETAVPTYMRNFDMLPSAKYAIKQQADALDKNIDNNSSNPQDRFARKMAIRGEAMDRINQATVTQQQSNNQTNNINTSISNEYKNRVAENRNKYLEMKTVGENAILTNKQASTNAWLQGIMGNMASSRAYKVENEKMAIARMEGGRGTADRSRIPLWLGGSEDENNVPTDDELISYGKNYPAKQQEILKKRPDLKDKFAKGGYLNMKHKSYC